MLCSKPHVMQGMAFGCGQCLPCRINKKRVWVHRLMLEAAQKKDNAFVTLTYSDENLPEGLTLVPKDVQDWLKRLRFQVKPLRLRFFLVGEYGDRTSRPHYHVALFGYPPCGRGRTDHRRANCCESCDRIRSSWGLGGIDVGTLTPESAAYIAGYVTKKLTNKDDPYVQQVLNGRHEEFARMSRHPGIGGEFADDIASVLLQHELVTPDLLPTSLRHGSRLLPLGSYLRNRIRERTGVSKEDVKEYNIAKSKAIMSELHESAYSTAPAGFKAFAFKQKIIEAGTGRRIQLQAKHKRTGKKDTL